jgi:predicted nucleotidyltransferase
MAAALAGVPGVAAVTLGGSRARGEQRADSDWDIGVYYREPLDVDGLRAPRPPRSSRTPTPP